MADFVGVIGYPDSLAILKRELLIFDRLIIEGTRYLLSNTGDPEKEHLVNEIDYLYDKGFILSAPRGEDIEITDDDGTITKQIKMQLTKIKANLNSKNLKVVRDKDLGELVYFLDNLNSIQDLNIRLLSLYLNQKRGLDAHPVLLNETLPLGKQGEPKSEVLNIVLKACPLPDESTSWEQIIDFRSDPDSRHKFLDLRNWMSEVAKGELAPKEAEEKLDYLISQYQRHMKLHEMKTKVGFLETVVVSGAEFAEDLIKFKWGKIAKGLFAFKQRRAALMEGELKAPGREIAYILKSRKVFPRKTDFSEYR